MLKMAKMKISLIEIKDSENVAIALKQIGLFDIVQINKVWKSLEIQILCLYFDILRTSKATLLILLWAIYATGRIIFLLFSVLCRSFSFLISLCALNILKASENLLLQKLFRHFWLVILLIWKKNFLCVIMRLKLTDWPSNKIFEKWKFSIVIKWKIHTCTMGRYVFLIFIFILCHNKIFN